MIANRIRALREARGMTQQDLAAKSGLLLRQIGRYESRETPQVPGGTKLVLLAKALGVTAAEILGEPSVDSRTTEDPAALVEFLSSPIGQKATEDEKAFLRRGHHALYGMTAESYQNLSAAYRASARGKTSAREPDPVNARAASRATAKGARKMPPKKKRR